MVDSKHSPNKKEPVEYWGFTAKSCSEKSQSSQEKRKIFIPFEKMEGHQVSKSLTHTPNGIYTERR